MADGFWGPCRIRGNPGAGARDLFHFSLHVDGELPSEWAARRGDRKCRCELVTRDESLLMRLVVCVCVCVYGPCSTSVHPFFFILRVAQVVWDFYVERYAVGIPREHLRSLSFWARFRYVGPVPGCSSNLERDPLLHARRVFACYANA